jgi:hypothetical protein
MSNKNNVNPDFYKVAGRDRPGEDVVHERQKQSLARGRARLLRQKRDRPGATRIRPQGGGEAEEKE